ncbi:hypothetical protein Psuf_078560 [Phytohabitans suffuscus]|uniref:Sugar ABC transporter permease YjfF n=1 Tax=Phytohabitans suffuscus TaxID=624315 RepID=A0A6F8YX17_9ACTN|nr:hypothetical protein Psuf_078560 [Phytohabitans suffuscus]
MTTFADVRSRLARPQQRRYLPLYATLALLALMYGSGVVQYEAFSDPQVVLNVFIDNGFLLVVAVGMTFVILTGGIDLSVGAVVALTTMVSATLLQEQGWPAFAVLPLVLLMGSTLGFGMGCIIHYFEIQPFIVTLAGMFLARACATRSAPRRSPSTTRSGPRWPSRRCASATTSSPPAWSSRSSWCSSPRTCWRSPGSAATRTRSAATPAPRT